MLEFLLVIAGAAAVVAVVLIEKNACKHGGKIGVDAGGFYRVKCCDCGYDLLIEKGDNVHLIDGVVYSFTPGNCTDCDINYNSSSQYRNFICDSQSDKCDFGNIGSYKEIK